MVRRGACSGPSLAAGAKSRCSTACSLRSWPARATPSAWLASRAWASRGWCTRPLRAMAARAESSLILEGRCVSYGSLVPYLPLIDLLRAHCGVLEDRLAGGDPRGHRRGRAQQRAAGRRGRVAASADQRRGRARGPRIAQPRSGQGAHVRCAAPAVPESLGQAATRHRRRGRALDRSDLRGIPDDAGRPAGRGADPPDCHLPAGLPRAMDGTLVRHADYDRPAQRRRERASCSGRWPAIKASRPRSPPRSCSAARATRSSSRSSRGRSSSTAPAIRRFRTPCRA